MSQFGELLTDSMAVKKNERDINFINFIKALAMLLILNSHLYDVYPISSLATGGAIGNALFFSTTGYLLAKVPHGFKKWYSKKLWRIYFPSTILILVSTLFLEHPLNFEKMIYRCVCLPNFWFLQALVFYYIAFYIIMRTDLKKHMFLITGLILSVYLVYYVKFIDFSVWNIEKYKSRVLYYFVFLLLGAYMRTNSDTVNNKHNRKYYGVCTLVSLFVFYAFKVFITVFPKFMYLQIVVHFLLWILMYYAYAFFTNAEEVFTRLSKRSIWNVVLFISYGSLEVYLVHQLIIDAFVVTALIWPVKLLLIVCCTMFSAYLFYVFVQFSEKLINEV